LQHTHTHTHNAQKIKRVKYLRHFIQLDLIQSLIQHQDRHNNINRILKCPRKRVLYLKIFKTWTIELDDRVEIEAIEYCYEMKNI